MFELAGMRKVVRRVVVMDESIDENRREDVEMRPLATPSTRELND